MLVQVPRILSHHLSIIFPSLDVMLSHSLSSLCPPVVTAVSDGAALQAITPFVAARLAIRADWLTTEPPSLFCWLHFHAAIHPFFWERTNSISSRLLISFSSLFQAVSDVLTFPYLPSLFPILFHSIHSLLVSFILTPNQQHQHPKRRENSKKERRSEKMRSRRRRRWIEKRVRGTRLIIRWRKIRAFVYTNFHHIFGFFFYSSRKAWWWWWRRRCGD